MMMLRKIAVVALGFFLSACAVTAQKNDEDALRDVQIGLQGLKQASEDPALLAQLMKDLQDPEMMAEAAKMMNDPAFKKNMEKLQSSKEFKDSVKKTKDVLSDPNQAAHLEAKMEHMQKVGNDQLKKRAGDAMEQAMASLSDPAVMAEMTKMLKDPKFQKDLENMTKDPQFQSYMEAMQDMMSDPRKKAKLEAAADAVRSSL